MRIETVILVVGLLVLVGVVLDAIRERRFRTRFPPIDDDEFIRRCSPGVNRDVALRVRRIMSNSLDIEYERIYPEQNFVYDLHLD
jgi:hypothetical protein